MRPAHTRKRWGYACSGGRRHDLPGCGGADQHQAERGVARVHRLRRPCRDGTGDRPVRPVPEAGPPVGGSPSPAGDVVRASRFRARFDDPTGARHGIPTFMWRSAPDGYATLRQLRAQGLRPGGQPVAAQIKWIGIGGERTAFLYLASEAKPKRVATPRQWEAITRALIARMRCPTCRLICNYVIPRSLGECLTCTNGDS